MEEIAPKKGERALILGASRSGKSVLLDMILRHAIQTRPAIEVFLADTKPRFRAELFKQGLITRNAEKFYKDWEKGPILPGSYRMDIHSEEPLKGYWKPKDQARIVVAQTTDETERSKILQIGTKWFNVQKRGADRLLVVDELLDFYHSNGICIDPRNNVPLKVNRAGGERGFSGLYGAQRPRGLSVQMVEELSILYLFHLRYDADMSYLYANGIPRSIVPPTEDYAFRMVRVEPGGRATDYGLFRLNLEPWYLNQLSET